MAVFLLMILAFVLLVLAATKIPQPFPFLPAGMALWALAVLVAGGVPVVK